MMDGSSRGPIYPNKKGSRAADAAAEDADADAEAEVRLMLSARLAIRGTHPSTHARAHDQQSETTTPRAPRPRRAQLCLRSNGIRSVLFKDTGAQGTSSVRG